jgi:hypothetical protein
MPAPARMQAFGEKNGGYTMCAAKFREETSKKTAETCCAADIAAQHGLRKPNLQPTVITIFARNRIDVWRWIFDRSSIIQARRLVFGRIIGRWRSTVCLLRQCQV